MKAEAITYVQNQLVRGKERLLPYTKSSTSFVYPSRHAFIKIDKYVRSFLTGQREKRWVIIPGLRGVGKTTLIAQLFIKYITQMDGQRMIYVSLDEAVSTLGLSLNDVLQAYEQILGKSFESQTDPIFIFVDEVQQDLNWAATLKSLHDKARNVFIICSGSSAVHLQSNPDVVRRAEYEKLYPLSFNEFEMIKNNVFPQNGLKREIMEAIYDSATATAAHEKLLAIERKVQSQWSRIDRLDIDEFLQTGTLPFTIRETDKRRVYENISLLLDKIILKDIQELGRFDSDTLSSIKRILFLLADSDSYSITKISSEIGMNKITLTNVLDTLEKAELLVKVLPKGASSSKVRKPSKYLFMSPTLRGSLLNVTGIDGTYITRKGKYLEDIAGMHFYREFVAPGSGIITYDTMQGGADFILQIANKRQFAIEIGIGDKGIKQVRDTMKREKCDFGIVFCSESLMLNAEENILRVPLDFFLLM